MSKKLRVGNLGFAIDTAKLSEIFATTGTVVSVEIIEDQYSGKSRGFGFVEMSSPQEALACVAALNGQTREGRVLNVAEAPVVPGRRKARARK